MKSLDLLAPVDKLGQVDVEAVPPQGAGLDAVVASVDLVAVLQVDAPILLLVVQAAAEDQVLTTPSSSSVPDSSAVKARTSYASVRSHQRPACPVRLYKMQNAIAPARRARREYGIRWKERWLAPLNRHLVAEPGRHTAFEEIHQQRQCGVAR